MAGLLNASNVSDMYQKYLGRAPEAGAADLWAKESEKGVDVEKGILGSQEYLSKQKPPTFSQPTYANDFTRSAPSTSTADAVKALAQGYTASQVNVTPESTSQYQLGKMLDSGSPLMKQAETQGLQQANKRGLLNSSIAVGAAQDSMIRSATPFAQQDANIYANAQTFNANSLNQANQFNASANNQISQFNATAQNQNNQFNISTKNQNDQFNADSALKLQLANIQANTSMSTTDKQIASQQAINESNNANKLQLANLDVTSKQALNKVDYDYKQLLQTNISAADMYKQYSTNIANISSNSNLNKEAKEAALQNQLNTLRAGLDAIGEVSSLNLGKYFEREEIIKPELTDVEKSMPYLRSQVDTSGYGD